MILNAVFGLIVTVVAAWAISDIRSSKKEEG
jgi:Co/Zn/Cd efflux system component